MRKLKKIIPLLVSSIALVSCGGAETSSISNDASKDSSASSIADASIESLEQSSSDSFETSQLDSDPVDSAREDSNEDVKGSDSVDSMESTSNDPEQTSQEKEAYVVSSLFAPVQDSPVNELDNDQLRGYINDAIALYNQKMMDLDVMFVYAPSIKSDRFDELMANEKFGPILSNFMSNNHLTDDEISSAIAFLGVFLEEAISIIYGGFEGNFDNFSLNSLKDSALPTLYQLCSNTDLLCALASLLRSVDLDHLFATIDDCGLFEFDSITELFDQFKIEEEAEENELLIEALDALPNDEVLLGLQEAREMTPNVHEGIKLEDVFDKDMGIAFIRFLKDSYIALDEVGFDLLFEKIASLVDVFSMNQLEPLTRDASDLEEEEEESGFDIDEMVELAKMAASIFETLDYPVSDFDHVLEWLADNASSFVETVAYAYPVVDLGALNTQLEVIDDLKNGFSGDAIKAVVHFYTSLCDGLTTSVVNNLKNGSYLSLLGVIVASYTKLTNAEKEGLKQLFQSFDIDLASLIVQMSIANMFGNDDAIDSGELISNFLGALLDKASAFNPLKRGFAKFYCETDDQWFYVDDEINAEALSFVYYDLDADYSVLFDGLSLDDFSSIYDEISQSAYASTSVTLLEEIDTSSAGYIDIHASVTFEEFPDQEFEYLVRNIPVYPSALKGAATFSDAVVPLAYIDEDEQTYLDSYLSIYGSMDNELPIGVIEFDYSLLDKATLVYDSIEEEPYQIPLKELEIEVFYSSFSPYGDDYSSSFVISLEDLVGEAPGYRSLDIDDYHFVYYVADTQEICNSI